MQRCQCKDDVTPWQWTPIPGRLYCNVEGKLWESCTKIMGPSEGLSEWFSGNYLDIQFLNFCKDTSTSIYLYIHEPIDTGYFNLSKNNFARYRIQTYPIEQRFSTNNQFIGTLHITKLDTLASKISGTLDFYGIDTTSNKTIHVSDGTFSDVTFHKQ